MAGLCGCWRVGSGSNGGCDGCGYKVLLRGALAPTTVRPHNTKKLSNNIQTSEKPPLPPATRHKQNEKREEASDGGERPLSLSSHHRRHSHPVRSPPEPSTDPHLPRSLQRRRLPQSSAYNVPLPPASPPTLVSLLPHWGSGGGNLEAKGPFAYSVPHQPLLLSTIQPPPELCPPTIIPPSPLTRTPPFDLSSFLPPSPSAHYSPPPSPRPGLSGLQLSGVSASTSLQVRYRALSLARAASTTRSHTDLRYSSHPDSHDAANRRNPEIIVRKSDVKNPETIDTVSLRFFDISNFQNDSEIKFNGCLGSDTLLPTQALQQHVNPNFYISKTLPAPAPPQQPRNYVVKQPQHQEGHKQCHQQSHEYKQRLHLQEDTETEMLQKERKPHIPQRKLYENSLHQQINQHQKEQKQQLQQQQERELENTQQPQQRQLCLDQYEQQSQQQQFLYQQLQDHQQFQLQLQREHQTYEHFHQQQQQNQQQQQQINQERPHRDTKKHRHHRHKSSNSSSHSFTPSGTASSISYTGSSLGQKANSGSNPAINGSHTATSGGPSGGPVHCRSNSQGRAPGGTSNVADGRLSGAHKTYSDASSGGRDKLHQSYWPPSTKERQQQQREQQQQIQQQFQYIQQQQLQQQYREVLTPTELHTSPHSLVKQVAEQDPANSIGRRLGPIRGMLDVNGDAQLETQV